MYNPLHLLLSINQLQRKLSQDTAALLCHETWEPDAHTHALQALHQTQASLTHLRIQLHHLKQQQP